MKIALNSVVAMDYELRVGDDDDVIDSSDDGTFAFLIGHGNVIPGLEEALMGLAAGAEQVVTVPPEKGYGVRDDSKMIGLPRSNLPPEFVVEIGLPLELEDEEGRSFPVWIAGTHGDDVVLDGNHPLAGETLQFSIKILEVRAATEEELSHGHVHGPGGHHHH